MPVALPALGEIAGALLTLLGWTICLGMTYAWRHTIGRGLIWVADEMDKASVDIGVKTVHIFGPLSAALRWVSNSIATWLGEAALACEHATLFLWNHAESIILELAHWIEDESSAVLHAFESLFTVTLPRYERKILHQVRDIVHGADAAINKAERAAERYARKEVLYAKARIEGIVHHAEHVITADVLPRIRTAEHDIEALKRKVDELLNSVAKGGLVALIGATIWKELFGGKKCSSWDNLVKKRGCSAWSDLDGLLEIAILTGTLASLPELISIAQAVTEDVTKGAQALLGE